METKQDIHTLMPLADFKAVLGVDDREDALSRYCLVTATYSIEQYCKRRLIRKKRFELFPFYGDYIFPLRDYPIREILAVYQTHALKESSIIENEFYHTIPECGEFEDIPFSLSVSPALRLVRELSGLKVHYRAGPENCSVNGDFSWPHAMPHYSSTRSMFRVHYVAGYAPGKVPADLASACLELAAWNMSRYRGRRIGITGNVRGSGKEGEHLEVSMPENVRCLLEPYRRRTI